jgi:hypothetical protein
MVILQPNPLYFHLAPFLYSNQMEIDNSMGLDGIVELISFLMNGKALYSTGWIFEMELTHFSFAGQEWNRKNLVKSLRQHNSQFHLYSNCC